MKSAGVQDIVKWMEVELKKKRAEITELHSTRVYGFEEGSYKDRQIDAAKAELGQMVRWKISTEKYLKKLRHQGE